MDGPLLSLEPRHLLVLSGKAKSASCGLLNGEESAFTFISVLQSIYRVGTSIDVH